MPPAARALRPRPAPRPQIEGSAVSFNLRNRSFLSLRDFTGAEIEFLLRLAADLKAAKYAGTERPMLRGKEIALIFEKASTRTRVGFEVKRRMTRARM